MEELLQTIERLKRSLTAIDNARKQVENTVAAYDDTQVKIEGYIDNLGGIENTLKSLISTLETKKVLLDQQATTVIKKMELSCDKVIENAQKELLSTSKDFKTSTDGNINRFDHAVKNVSELTAKMENTSAKVAQLVDSMSALEQELRSSQNAQDVEIAKINASSNNITDTLSTQDVTLGKQNQTLQDIISKIVVIDCAINNLTQLCISIQTSIESSTTSLQTSIDSLCKRTKQNRKISSAILILIIMFTILIMLMR